jgi:hypothetical protein
VVDFPNFHEAAISALVAWKSISFSDNAMSHVGQGTTRRAGLCARKSVFSSINPWLRRLSRSGVIRELLPR